MNNNKEQRDNLITPRRFWIIGAGRFGQIAVERITRHISGATLTIVDKKPYMFDGAGITTILEDGVHWLETMLVEDAPVDMIIPAIPVHLASGWLRLKLKNLYEIYPLWIPDAWLTQMPHAFGGAAGQIYVSHADFICPDNCPEPDKICTHTGKPRPMDLFRLLGDLDFEDVLPIVLRSHQLLPGVGGIYPADLFSAMDTVCKNSHRPFMIATACRCHGVVDFIRLERKPETDKRT